MEPTHNSDEECYQDTLDAVLKHLLDRDAISMSWCDEREEFVFFMTDEQKAQYDFGHH